MFIYLSIIVYQYVQFAGRQLVVPIGIHSVVSHTSVFTGTSGGKIEGDVVRIVR